MKKLFFLLVLLFLTIVAFGQIKIVTDKANFRSSPEFKKNILCKIPKGTVVSVVTDTIEYDNWVKIKYNDRIGFVYKDLIKDVTSNDTTTQESSVRYYRNSNGEKVQSPTHYNSVPVGATAECWDGTYSFSKNRRGTCSHHGGVKKWLK
ncbi:MAG TPA: DUF3761 domain-containing protein [Bacteroidales bacterium]